MSVLDGIRLALKGLNRCKLQSVLTTLGVTFGVAAVLTMVALGSGARAAMSRHIRTAGTNIVTVEAGNYERFASAEIGRFPSLPAETWPEGGLVPDDPSAGAGTRPAPAPPASPPAAGRQPWWPQPTDRPTLPGQGASTRLTVADGEAIRQIPGVELVAAGVADSTRIVAGERRHFTRLEGADVDLASIHGWTLEHGRFFTAEEVAGAAQVAVLGIAVSRFLFGEGANPVGQQVEMQERTFSVIGVTGGQGRTAAPPDVVYAPLAAAQSMLNIPHLHRLEIAAESAGVASRVATEVAELLRARHQIRPDQADDFRVRTQVREALLGKGLAPNFRRSVVGNVPTYEHLVLEEMSLTLEQAGRTMAVLLVAIASVALLVGGIGIMNVMLVSTSDRTQEIGVRRMVGARERDVLLQFLLEAATLSIGGGGLGILLGYAAATALTHAFGWASDIPPLAVLFTFVAALVVGIFFGLYPARQAARVDVVQILHDG